MLLLGACSSTTGSSGLADPEPEEPGESGISVAPRSAHPGQELALSFPPENQRGGYYYLSSWNGETWNEPLYQLESDGTRDTPGHVTVNPTVTRQSYGVEGPGPDHVVLPDDVVPGPWRLCMTDPPYACVQVIVIDR